MRGICIPQYVLRAVGCDDVEKRLKHLNKHCVQPVQMLMTACCPHA